MTLTILPDFAVFLNENNFKHSKLASPFKHSSVPFMNEPAFLNESVSLIFNVTFQLFK